MNIVDFDRSLVSVRNEELRTEVQKRYLKRQLRTSREQRSANRRAFEFGAQVKNRRAHIGRGGPLTVGSILRRNNWRTLWR